MAGAKAKVGATPAPTADAAAPGTIRMLVGMEGPDVSRVRLQLLAIGADVDADEAARLVAAGFAEQA